MSNPQQPNQRQSEEPHPFNQVFSQIEGILKFIDDNKEKPLDNAPPWVIDELDRIGEALVRMQKGAERLFPAFNEYTEESLLQMLASIPKEQRTPEIAMIEMAQDLKRKTLEIQKQHPYASPPVETKGGKKGKAKKSPMELLNRSKTESKAEQKKEDRQSEIERRTKYGRIGGKKNWRPI